MNSSVRQHAEILVDHSTEVTSGDDVIIRASPSAEPLVVALHEAIGERGGNPAISSVDTRAHRAFMLAADPDEFGLPEHVLAFIEAADVIIDIKGDRNIHEREDIPAKKSATYSQAIQPLGDAQTNTRYVLTQYPATGNAQKAEMSTSAYRNFVWNAINKDWENQRAFQEQLVKILDPADDIRLVSGDATDIRMSIGGNSAKSDFAKINLPGGEVYTAPVPDSARGTVLFDEPVLVRGREIRELWLRFVEGEVVEYRAETNEEVVESLLNTDDGASRLGEVGIGMNRSIDRFTHNMLFDEKMGKTVHLALGRAYEETVGENNTHNNSAIHQDLLINMSEKSVIEVDGTVVQRNGIFIFEDEF